MVIGETQPRLPCGVALDALIDQVVGREQPRDSPHQSVCAHCRSALRALGEAWGELQAFAGEPVAVPKGLSEQIMVRIKLLISRTSESVVLSGPRGETLIAERVVGQIARRAALSVPGVVLATALRVTAEPGAAADSDDTGRARLSLRLAIIFGPPVDALAAAVRARVSEHVRDQTGVSVSAVDIAVEDVIPVS